MTDHSISPENLFKGLADPIRLRLVSLLLARDEVCVCHLQEALELPQPTVSRHLARLRKCGLVLGRKDGHWVYYRLAESQTDLQRRVLGSLSANLSELALLRCDRERLSSIGAACEGPQSMR